MSKTNPLSANRRITRLYLADSADPDALTGPFATCPFSSPEGAAKYIRGNLREMIQIAEHCHRGETPAGGRAARWYEWINLHRLLRCTLRACAAYERLAYTEFAVDTGSVKRQRRGSPYKEIFEWCLSKLGEEDDPGEIAVNEVLIQLDRTYFRITHDAKYFQAVMRYKEHQEKRKYTEEMLDSGWTEDDFPATKNRKVVANSDW